MDPSSYKAELSNADAVVHSMGILLEADYKGLLSGKEPIVSGVKKVFDSARGTGANTVREGKGNFSYETMNRDTGLLFPQPRRKIKLFQ